MLGIFNYLKILKSKSTKNCLMLYHNEILINYSLQWFQNHVKSMIGGTREDTLL
jgi:hypothetical protein